MPGEQWPISCQVGAFHDQFVILGAEVLCYDPRIGQLVVCRNVEANRERFNRLTHQLAHDSGANAGVYASTEHCSQWYIRHHTFFYRLPNMLPDTLDIFLGGKALCLTKCVIPVAFLTKRPIFIK